MKRVGERQTALRFVADDSRKANGSDIDPISREVIVAQELSRYFCHSVHAYSELVRRGGEREKKEESKERTDQVEEE